MHPTIAGSLHLQTDARLSEAGRLEDSQSVHGVVGRRCGDDPARRGRHLCKQRGCHRLLPSPIRQGLACRGISRWRVLVLPSLWRYGERPHHTIYALLGSHQRSKRWELLEAVTEETSSVLITLTPHDGLRPSDY